MAVVVAEVGEEEDVVVGVAEAGENRVHELLVSFQCYFLDKESVKADF